MSKPSALNLQIRAALGLVPADHLAYRNGPNGMGWYVQKFGGYPSYLGGDGKLVLKRILRNKAQAEAEIAEREAQDASRLEKQ